MNRRLHRNYLLAVISAATIACTAVEQKRVTITRTFPASAIQHINLREVNGSLDVTAAPVDQVTLVAHVASRGVDPDHSKENDGYFETRLEGGTLLVGNRRHVHLNIPFLFSNDVSIDYELRVPPSVALDLKTVNGRIATRGVDAEMEATTVNGSLDLEMSGSKELVAHSVNGRVRARFLSDFQGAHLKTVNGSVEAVLPANASFACDLSQVNGDFEAAFPLSIHSNPGRRRVSGEVNGGRHDLYISTVNGDIHLENMPSPPQAPAAPAAPSAVPAVPAAPAAPAAPAPAQSDAR